MSEEEEYMVLRSEEVNEVISSPPRWIFRWGISVIFALIVLGTGLSYFISYPDVLTGDVTITTMNPPAKLIARTDGRIAQLLVKNNALIKADQPIAVIENPADFRDVLYLDSMAAYISTHLNDPDSVSIPSIKDGLHAGELTPAYLMILKSEKDLNLYRQLNSYNQRISLLKRDLVNYNSLGAKYKSQQAINDEQLSIIQGDYERDQKLFEQGTISAREFDNKKKEYLAAQSANEQIKILSSNLLIQINSIEKSILELQIQDYKEQEQYRSEFRQNIKTLIDKIAEWKRNFLIVSPINGKISFFDVWAANQNVKAGDELFSVVPSERQIFVGKCTLPVANSGKVSIGQNVNIKLTNYPYTETGMLHGVVSNIARVPKEGLYAVDIGLPDGMLTTYNKRLAYKEEMKGQAEIITRNHSVLERIFFNFRKLANRQ